MLAAALAYAARGWPVFPCSPADKKPLVGAAWGKPKGSGGLKKASADAGQVTHWWTKWPAAMIGLPTGLPINLFAVDFDAGVDEKTGEVFEADALIAALEREIGEELPATWTVETPRGGRHAYFVYPGALGNRAGIIHRVDVRGDGGYVIAPPSLRGDGRAYRWLDQDGLAMHAPAPLLDLILRQGKWGRGGAGEAPGYTATPIGDRSTSSTAVDDVLHKYALSALDSEARELAGAGEGTRNDAINKAAFALGQLAAAGVLSEAVVRSTLQEVVRAWPNWRKSFGTIDSGIRAGLGTPRDLREIRSKAEARKSRQGARVSPAPLRLVEASGEAGGDPAPRPSPARGEGAGVQIEMREMLRARRRRRDPPAAEPRGGVFAAIPPRWEADELGLPREDPCPVVPLGISGRHYHMLDSAGQYTAVAASSLNQAGIQDLFAAAPNYPEWMCPRFGKAKKNPVTGEVEVPIASHQGDDVRKLLFRACQRMGLFDPKDKIRGRGAWKLRDGSLYYHAGEEIWIVEGGRIRAIETGLIEDGSAELVFPRLPALPAPWTGLVDPQENPARELLDGFRGWSWERPDVDPILLLGWIGMAFLGGALSWRPAVFLVGDKGTGKSTLQAAIEDIFGDALVHSVNTSAAGVYQTLGHDARPVAVDEIEASGDNRKVMAVIELARQAASGGEALRGSADAKVGGIEFQLASAFLFSAINPPPLLPQDLSRMCILRLRPLDLTRSPKPPAIDVETCGRKVLARLMLEWHRFPETLEAYRQALIAGGHDGRGADTYGQLLACADLIVGPDLAGELGLPMVDDLSAWSTLLAAASLPEVQDALESWRACYNHLLQSRVEVWRSGERATVGQLLDDLRDKDGGLTADHAKRQLAQAGLGLAHDRRGWLLAVPNQSPMLERLFYGTRWQGAPGAGGWAEALRRGPEAIFLRDAGANRIRINGVQQRCTIVLIDEIDRETAPGAPRPRPGGASGGQPAEGAGKDGAAPAAATQPLLLATSEDGSLGPEPAPDQEAKPRDG